MPAFVAVADGKTPAQDALEQAVFSPVERDALERDALQGERDPREPARAARLRVEGLGAVIREVSRDDPALEVDFHLHGREFADADVGLLASLGEVVRLHLGHTQISDRGVAALAELSGLRELDLSNTAIDGSGLRALEGLRDLQVLNLHGTRVGDGVLESLAAMPALQRAYLWGSQVSWQAAAGLAIDRPDLRLHLGAGSKAFPPPFVASAEQRAKAFERLRAVGAAIRKVSQQGDELEVDFHLGGTAVTDADLSELRNLGPVTDLNLANCAIGDEAAAFIAQCRGLRRLHLQNTKIGDAGIERIAHLRRLEYLNLYGTPATDRATEALGAMPALAKVFLWQTGVSWEGAELLRGRREGLVVDRGWDPEGPAEWIPPTPEEQAAAEAAIVELGGAIRRVDQASEDVEVDFHLGGSGLDDAGLAHVRSIPHLVELNLAGTKISAEGLRHLAGMPSLRRLHLENTAVGDAALEQVRYLTKLEYLNLYGTEVSDAGLLRLRTLRRLTRLYLWQSKATADGVSALAAWLPEMQAEFGWELSP